MAPFVTMSSLGRNGRFGNQIFQYAFLRLYAQKHRLAYRVPHWIGQELFGHNDPPIGNLRLPLFHDQLGQSTILDRLTQPVENVDVCGYFQYHTSYYAPHKRQFRSFFRPVPRIAAPLEDAVGRLKNGGRSLVAIHVRRGDFGGGIHYAAPLSWYVDWIRKSWKRWRNPLLYVASDDPQLVVKTPDGVRALDASSLGVNLAHAPYYADHYVLSHADAVAISNSSFSFSGAMLNETAVDFVRPSRRAEGLIAFDPWNSDPMLIEGARDMEAQYYEETYERIVRAVENYHADKHSPSCRAEVRACRLGLAWLWLGMSDDALRVVYNTSLAKAQILLMSPAIRELSRSAGEQRQALSLQHELAKGLGSTWATQYLLAAMLLCDPSELSMPHDLSQLPQWLLPDYLQYLRSSATARAKSSRRSPAAHASNL